MSNHHLNGDVCLWCQTCVQILSYSDLSRLEKNCSFGLCTFPFSIRILDLLERVDLPGQIQDILLLLLKIVKTCEKWESWSELP